MFKGDVAELKRLRSKVAELVELIGTLFYVSSVDGCSDEVAPGGGRVSRSLL